MKSFIVGRDHGGDFQYGAVFAVEDLDGLLEYLTHPATYQTDHFGLDLVEDLHVFDVSDDNDPELNAKIQGRRRVRLKASEPARGVASARRPAAGQPGLPRRRAQSRHCGAGPCRLATGWFPFAQTRS